MSQQAVLSQTAPMDPSHGLGTSISLPTLTPLGLHSAPPCAESSSGDIELGAVKRIVDVEAGGIATTQASDPGEGNVGGNRQRQTTISDVLKKFVFLSLVGLPSTCFFGGLGGGLGTMILFAIPPFTAADYGAELKALLIGALVVAPVTGVSAAAVGLVLRRLSSAGSRPARVVSMVLDVCDGSPVVFATIYVPPSVFAMPLGFVMLPRLATEAFGPWQALVVSATGFGAPAVLILLLLGLGRMFWWCGTARR